MLVREAGESLRQSEFSKTRYLPVSDIANGKNTGVEYEYCVGCFRGFTVASSKDVDRGTDLRD